MKRRTFLQAIAALPALLLGGGDIPPATGWPTPKRKVKHSLESASLDEGRALNVEGMELADGECQWATVTIKLPKTFDVTVLDQ